MTEKEILQRKESFKENVLFKQSTSPYKDFQYEQFHVNGVPLEGQNSRSDNINGKELLVIFNFKNGLLHSDDENTPAIQYPGHWEFWKNGLVDRVYDDGGNTVEYWEDGIPVSIEKNRSDQQN